MEMKAQKNQFNKKKRKRFCQPKSDNLGNPDWNHL